MSARVSQRLLWCRTFPKVVRMRCCLHCKSSLVVVDVDDDDDVEVERAVAEAVSVNDFHRSRGPRRRPIATRGGAGRGGRRAWRRWRRVRSRSKSGPVARLPIRPSATHSSTYRHSPEGEEIWRESRTISRSNTSRACQRSTRARRCSPKAKDRDAPPTWQRSAQTAESTETPSRHLAKDYATSEEATPSYCKRSSGTAAAPQTPTPIYFHTRTQRDTCTYTNTYTHMLTTHSQAQNERGKRGRPRERAKLRSRERASTSRANRAVKAMQREQTDDALVLYTHGLGGTAIRGHTHLIEEPKGIEKSQRRQRQH